MPVRYFPLFQQHLQERRENILIKNHFHFRAQARIFSCWRHHHWTICTGSIALYKAWHALSGSIAQEPIPCSINHPLYLSPSPLQNKRVVHESSKKVCVIKRSSGLPCCQVLPYALLKDPLALIRLVRLRKVLSKGIFRTIICSIRAAENIQRAPSPMDFRKRTSSILWKRVPFQKHPLSFVSSQQQCIKNQEWLLRELLTRLLLPASTGLWHFPCF